MPKKKLTLSELISKYPLIDSDDVKRGRFVLLRNPDNKLHLHVVIYTFERITILLPLIRSSITHAIFTTPKILQTDYSFLNRDYYINVFNPVKIRRASKRMHKISSKNLQLNKKSGRELYGIISKLNKHEEAEWYTTDRLEK